MSFIFNFIQLFFTAICTKLGTPPEILREIKTKKNWESALRGDALLSNWARHQGSCSEHGFRCRDIFWEFVDLELSVTRGWGTVLDVWVYWTSGFGIVDELTACWQCWVTLSPGWWRLSIGARTDCLRGILSFIGYNSRWSREFSFNLFVSKISEQCQCLCKRL